MIEKIFSDLYKLEIPLPNNPLRALNSYVIETGRGHLIIDTGMNRPECLSAMQAGLEQLGVNLQHSDFFVTHMHADHSGLIRHLATDSSKIYCGQPDADIIRYDDYWEEMLNFIRTNGFPEVELQGLLQKNPAYRYRSVGPVDFSVVEDGDQLDIGNYSFRCVRTPGHTKGHMCLFEPDKKLFIGGDHILDDITPNISLWSDRDNPLQNYLNSLEKVYELNIELVLPAHRNLITKPRERIRELQQHHYERADEVLAILTKGHKTAYQVSSEMSWDMTCSWEQFPVAQKWFAIGEALSHLKYLVEKGLVRKEYEERLSFYSVVLT